MHLTPGDVEKLLLATAGMVARDRLARGVLLNYPESVALLSTWVIERAREGASVAELMDAGRQVLTAEQVMTDVRSPEDFHDQHARPRARCPSHRPRPDRDQCRSHAPGATAHRHRQHRRSPRPDWFPYPPAERHAALEFERAACQGHRLDIPSGTSQRFEPGVSREVDIVALRGQRRVPGIQIGGAR